jgi:hypothetical protein
MLRPAFGPSRGRGPCRETGWKSRNTDAAADADDDRDHALQCRIHGPPPLEKGMGRGVWLLSPAGAGRAGCQRGRAQSFRAAITCIASQLAWISVATSAAACRRHSRPCRSRTTPAPTAPGIRSDPSKRKVVAFSKMSPSGQRRVDVGVGVHALVAASGSPPCAIHDLMRDRGLQELDERHARIGRRW